MSVLFVGRPRDRAANEMAAEYSRRLGRFCEFQMREIRNEAAIEKHDRAFRIVLDPGGRHLTSEELAGVVRRAENTAVRELLFLVGGAAGLSDRVREQADLLLALSRLTLPHELARVLLTEQIYRAFTILRGHPYPR